MALELLIEPEFARQAVATSADPAVAPTLSPDCVHFLARVFHVMLAVQYRSADTRFNLEVCRTRTAWNCFFFSCIHNRGCMSRSVVGQTSCSDINARRANSIGTIIMRPVCEDSKYSSRARKDGQRPSTGGGGHVDGDGSGHVGGGHVGSDGAVGVGAGHGNGHVGGGGAVGVGGDGIRDRDRDRHRHRDGDGDGSRNLSGATSSGRATRSKTNDALPMDVLAGIRKFLVPVPLLDYISLVAWHRLLFAGSLSQCHNVASHDDAAGLTEATFTTEYCIPSSSLATTGGQRQSGQWLDEAGFVRACSDLLLHPQPLRRSPSLLMRKCMVFGYEPLVGFHNFTAHRRSGRLPLSALALASPTRVVPVATTTIFSVRIDEATGMRVFAHVRAGVLRAIKEPADKWRKEMVSQCRGDTAAVCLSLSRFSSTSSLLMLSDDADADGADAGGDADVDVGAGAGGDVGARASSSAPARASSGSSARATFSRRATVTMLRVLRVWWFRLCLFLSRTAAALRAILSSLPSLWNDLDGFWQVLLIILGGVTLLLVVIYVGEGIMHYWRPHRALLQHLQDENQRLSEQHTSLYTSWLQAVNRAAAATSSSSSSSLSSSSSTSLSPPASSLSL